MIEHETETLHREFVGSLVGQSRKSTNPEIRTLAEHWWEEANNQMAFSLYFNMKLVAKSLNMLPAALKNIPSMGHVTVAFALQWLGPNDIKNKYIQLRLNKVLAWPEQDAETVQELARVRLNISLQTFAPKSTIYDLNFMRLGLPEKDFMQAMYDSLENRPVHLSKIDLMKRRTTLFKTLLSRRKIYSTFLCRSRYEDQAAKNLKLYLNSLGIKNPEKLVLTES